MFKTAIFQGSIVDVKLQGGSAVGNWSASVMSLYGTSIPFSYEYNETTWKLTEWEGAVKSSFERELRDVLRCYSGGVDSVEIDIKVTLEERKDLRDLFPDKETSIALFSYTWKVGQGQDANQAASAIVAEIQRQCDSDIHKFFRDQLNTGSGAPSKDHTCVASSTMIDKRRFCKVCGKWID